MMHSNTPILGRCAGWGNAHSLETHAQLRRQQIRAQAVGEVGMVHTPGLQHCHLSGVEAHEHVPFGPKSHGCPPLGPAPRLVGPVAMSGAVHPQVAA